jgi:hypothetical protein
MINSFGSLRYYISKEILMKYLQCGLWRPVSAATLIESLRPGGAAAATGTRTVI